MAHRNLIVRAGFDARGMRNGIQSANSQLSAFGRNANRTMNGLNSTVSSTMGKIGKIIGGALAIGSIISFGKECIELGSDLSEVQNVVDVTFGKLSKAVDQFASTAIEQFGLSETAAKRYTGTMGAMLKSSGIATSQALEMSKTITGLSADMASFYNLSNEVAFEKIRSGISGETEPLKQLGINMSVANLQAYAMSQGITKAYSSMTQAEQTLLRYNYLLSVTSDVQGDFARTSDSWANQVRILSEQFNALKATIGQGLIPALTPVVKGLNFVIAKLRVAAGYFKAFMELIFGKGSTSEGSGATEVTEAMSDSVGGLGRAANNASDAVDGIGDSAKKAGKEASKAAKKAKGALLGFDELNQLNISEDKNSGGSGGSGSGGKPGGSGGGGGSGLEDMGGAVDVDLGSIEEGEDKLSTLFDKLIEQLKHLKELFAEGFEIGIGGDYKERLDDIKDSIQGIKTSLVNIFTDPAVVNSAQGLADSIAFNMGKIAGSMASIGITIAQNLLGGIDKYLEQNAQYIKDRLVGIMDASAEIANLAGDFSAAFADIFSVFGDETGQQITANIIGIFSNGFLGSVELATKFGQDILSVITVPIVENKDLIKNTLAETLKPIETITGTIKDFVTNTFISINEAYNAHLKPAFDNIKTALSSLLENLLNNYNTHILPVIDGIANKVKDLYESHIQPSVDKFIDAVGRIIEAGSRILLEVVEPLAETLNNLLGPAIGFVIDVVSDLAIKLTTELIVAFSSIADTVADVCEWFAEHKVVTEVLIVILGALATAIGIVTIAMNLGAIAQTAMTVATTAWSTITGIATAVTTGFGTAMALLTSPITLVVVAITAVIATVVLLIRHWDDVKEGAKNCWEGIKNTWNTVSNWFKEKVVEPVKKFFTDLWNTIKTTAKNCWDTIVSAWQGACNWFTTKIIEPIKQKFSEWKTAISNLASQAWQGVVNAWNTACNWFKQTIIEPIKTAWSTAWNNIKGFADNCVNGIKSSFNSFKSWIGSIVDGIKKIFSNLWDNITNGCKSAINGLIGKVESGINKMSGAVNKVTGIVGIEIPKVSLPKLARGGIVDGATNMGNYIAGEAGKEMIVPLENTSFTDKIASAMGQAVMNAMNIMLSGNSVADGNNKQNVTLEMDGTTLARSITPYIVKEMRRLDLI